jgi:hypothetical protein
MVNELSKYDMGIAFKQKWVKKYWTLTTMEHMETKEFHDYVINIKKILIPNQYNEQSLEYKP